MTKPKKITSQRTRKPAASPARTFAGSLLTRQETTNLLLQAKEAFDYQSARGRVEPGENFADWRRDQVMDVCGKSGLSKIARSDWRAVKAHFLNLSGREDESFKLLNQTGLKSYRPASPGDTWENCEEYAAIITACLAAHLATAVTHPKGHIHAGWLIATARQRTGKPSLTLATLADRLDPSTLHGLLSHLRNHIATREGRAVPELRKKRVYPKKADPGEMAD
jgi:hypothetical protein